MRLTVIYKTRPNKIDKVYEIDSLDQVEEKIKEYFDESEVDRVLFTIEGIATYERKVVLNPALRTFTSTHTKIE